MPEVSVIVPVYGVGRYIEKCIQSVIHQSFSDWELILVDDGSTDNSGEICDRYAEMHDRIKTIHTENKGVSHARNTGLRGATGKFIVFIDGDDWVEATYLESMVNHAGDGRTIVYGNVVNDYSDGRASAIVFDYKDGETVSLDHEVEKLIQYKILENGFPIAKLFDREVISQNGLRFDENLSYHEDHLFVLNYLKHVDRVVLSSCADYHYEHRSGVSSLSKKRHTSLKLVDASSKLIEAIGEGNARWGIPDNESYLKRLHTYLGLNQLMMALRNADSASLESVCGTIRSRRMLFKKFYSPNHGILRLIPRLVDLHAEMPYKYWLIWKERHS